MFAVRPFPVVCAFLLIGLGRLGAEQTSAIRPALLGGGPTSLINVLDPQRLMKRGQTDAVVNFDFFVSILGTPYALVTYGGTPASEALSQELVDNLERARFIPAVYHGERVGAFVAGTLIFAVTDGKPHLRIFLNQEQEHMMKGDDFISPQQLFPINRKFKHFDDRSYRTVPGMVAVRIDTDAAGRLVGSKLLREHPPGGGFGMAVMKNIDKVTFSPGFLHGQPIACSTTWQIPFAGPGRGKHWLSQSKHPLTPVSILHG